MCKRFFVQAALAMAMALAVHGGAASAGASSRQTTASLMGARLDGRQVGIKVAADHHCHDALHGVLQCFTTATARDASLREMGAIEPSATTSEGYVIAWVGASYTGASVVLTQDYANLTTIGWNDRISSYKVYANLTGAFFEHSNYWGLTQYFCCFSQVTYVGDAYNDKFSSIDLP